MLVSSAARIVKGTFPQSSVSLSLIRRPLGEHDVADISHQTTSKSVPGSHLLVIH